MKRYSERGCTSLLRKAQHQLASTLNGLDGKEVEAEDSYLLSGAQHLANLCAAYCSLRRRHPYASKIVIRPALEMMFSFAAVLSDSSYLYWKFHHEFDETIKMISEDEKIIRKRASAGDRRRLIKCLNAERKSCIKDFKAFERSFKRDRAKSPLRTSKWNAAAAAQAAGLGDWYGQYRTYCQFTHGAVKALNGS